MDVSDIHTDECTDSLAVICVKESAMSADMLYAGIGVGLSVLLTALVIAVCCRIYRKRSTKATSDTILAEGYSEAVDSIATTEPSPRPPRGDKVEYEDPDDAVRGRHAVTRLSIADGEYDTLNTHVTTNTEGQHTVPQTQQTHVKPQHTVNAYSHVDIVNINNRYSGSDVIYDVSSFSLKKHAATQSQTGASNTYGNVQIT